jgi:Beta-galactosidase
MSFLPPTKRARVAGSDPHQQNTREKREQIELKKLIHAKQTLSVSGRSIKTFNRSLRLPLIVLALFVASNHGRAQIPQGVFSIANLGLPPQDEVLNNPNVDGVTVRLNWADLEPTEGQYDFTYLDTTLASVNAVGKKALLRVMTQGAKPAWVTTAIQNAGGLFFTFTTKGTKTTIPVFWDPTFLAKKTAMIQALGAHLTITPGLAIVVASFANATSEDWNVPHTSADVTQWQSLGYTSDKLIGAGHMIIDATMAAFPNQFVTLAVAGNGTKLDKPNPDPTYYVASTVIDDERALWPCRLIVQKNDLSTFIPAYPGTDTIYDIMIDSAPDIAGQMLFQCFGDSTYKVNKGIPIDPGLALTLSINNGVAYGEKYIEVYQVDVVNLPDVITYAHDALTAP